MDVMRTKSIEQSIAETDEEGFRLKKNLSALDLTVFGIGVIIGAGIFTLTGRAAADYAGPSIALSFVLAAVCCGLAALCYAEFASTVPVSGSAYTFSYASLGELVAWVIGWDLLLELMLGASVVAQGWSQYAVLFLDKIGITVPEAVAPGSAFDLPAFLLVAVLTALIAIGIKESLRVNLVLVAVKLFIVLFVIFAGIAFIDSANYSPFIPPASSGEQVSGITAPLIQVLFGLEPTTYGVLGIVSGASIVFFAYIGFDVVATTAEEARNPQRDLPIGIIASLVICTVLYVATTLVITGMVKYDKIDPDAALAAAFESVGKPGYATLIAAGAVAGLMTVVMTLIIGATRVTFAMSRDWLLPPRARPDQPEDGHPGAADAHHRDGDRPRLEPDAHRQARGDGQHRDAVGLRAGLDRGAGAAPEAARPQALVHRAVLARAAGARRAHQRLPHAQPVGRDVDPLPRLDGRRLRHLLHLRRPALAAGGPGARRGRAVDSGSDASAPPPPSP